MKEDESSLYRANTLLQIRVMELERQVYDLQSALRVCADLLKRAMPIIEQDARMMADLTRHAPLPPEAQAKHDKTEYESERLLKEVPVVLDHLNELSRNQ